MLVFHMGCFVSLDRYKDLEVSRDHDKNTTAASIINPWVVEVSTASFLHQEASLSVQPTVEVKHGRFYCYGSESGDSDKSICSNESSSIKDANMFILILT